MEVTKDNFEELLPEILDSIDKSCFIAIDCEMTGLSVNDEKANYFETVEDRYHVLRESASQFLVIQFGLCPFFYDEKKDEFSHKVYNFYTFPRSTGRDSPNIRFLCESSSLEFLASCGFDFNKLIHKGIPYLSIPNEERMRQRAEKRMVDFAPENSVPMNVPDNLRSFIEDVDEKIKRLKLSQLKDISLKNLTNYQRKLIFQNIKPKYSDAFYFESVLDEETSPEPAPAPVAVPIQIDESTESIGEKESTKAASKQSSTPDVTPSSNGRNAPRILKITRMTEEELSARAEEKKQIEMEKITQCVGFAKVIRAISESKKVVVGHNMLLDISYCVHQFVDDLPATLKEFKLLVQSTFPNLIDTKLMASSHPFRELVTSSVLGDLLKRLEAEPFTMPVVSTADANKSYGAHEKKEHEAGYDAYITGLCFLGMSQYLGFLHAPKKSRVLPESPVVMPFLNKLYLMRMQDMTYLNISGTDLTPSRSHVFYVTCPRDSTGKSILSLFSSFGNIQMWWRSDTSLFVSLSDKSQAPFVISNIEAKHGFTVIPFEQHQKQTHKNQEEKKRHRSGSQNCDNNGVNGKATTASSTPVCREEIKTKRLKTDSDEKPEAKQSVKQLFQEPTWS